MTFIRPIPAPMTALEKYNIHIRLLNASGISPPTSRMLIPRMHILFLDITEVSTPQISMVGMDTSRISVYIICTAEVAASGKLRAIEARSGETAVYVSSSDETQKIATRIRLRVLFFEDAIEIRS